MADGTPIVVPLIANLKPLKRGLRNANRRLSSFSASTTKIMKGVAASAAAAAIVISKGVQEFVDLDKKVREVLTLSGDTGKEAVKNMTRRIRAIATEYGQSAEDVSKGFYDAISAGVDTELVDKFAADAAKLASAGATDIATSVDLLTSAVNAYGYSAEDATKISDIMFGTVRAGKTTIGEIAESFSNMGPVAASLGVDLETVNAWLASLTLSGTPTTLATTQIKGALVELGKAGTGVNKAIEEATGKTFRDFIASGGTLAEALDHVGSAAAKDGKELSDMFSNVRAVQGVLGITGANASQFSDILGNLGDSTGETDKAFKTMSEGASFQFAKLKEQLKAVLAVIGEAALPVILELAGHLSKVFNQFPRYREYVARVARWFQHIATIIKKDLGPAFEKLFGWIKPVFDRIKAFFEKNPEVAFAALAGVLGTALLGALVAVTPKLVAFAVAIGPIGALLIAAGAGFAYFYSESPKFREAVQDLADVVAEKGILGAFVHGWQQLWMVARAEFNKAWELIGSDVVHWLNWLDINFVRPLEELLRDVGFHPTQVVEAFKEVGRAIQREAPGILTWIRDNFVIPLEESLQDFDLHPEQISAQFRKAFEDDTVGLAVVELFTNLGEFIAAGWVGLWTLFKEGWVGLKDLFVEGWAGLWTLFKEGWAGLAQIAVDGWRNLVASMDDGKRPLYQDIGDFWVWLVDKFTMGWATLGAGFVYGWVGLFTKTVEGARAVMEKIRSFNSGWREAGSDWVANLVDGVLDALRSAASSIRDAVMGVFEPVGRFFGGVASFFKGGGSAIAGLSIPMFAKGGIVTSPTLGVLGESGPEAVIPLDQMSNIGGMTVINNFYIDSAMSSPNEIAERLESLLTQRVSHKGSLDFLEYS